jgi:predicted nucleic acid-binding protein
MAAVLIDSNVLLDLMTEDGRWFSWSAEAVERAAGYHRLVINPVIYAEVSIRFPELRIWMQRYQEACLIESPFRMRPPFSPANRL